MILNKIKNYIKNQTFYPTKLGIFIHPGYILQKRRLEKIKYFAKGIKFNNILDVGCGTKPYEVLFNTNSYIGLDIEKGFHENNTKLNNVFYYNGEKFPFENNSFDHVISIQVLEHVFEPEHFLKELHRVLKFNGTMFITVPFCGYEHEIPYDYGRYTSFGIDYLLTKNGFDIIEQSKTGNYIETLTQLLVLYIYEKCATKYGIINLFISLMCSPIMILGLILSKILPKSDTLYLDNVVIARKL